VNTALELSQLVNISYTGPLKLFPKIRQFSGDKLFRNRPQITCCEISAAARKRGLFCIPSTCPSDELWSDVLLVWLVNDVRTPPGGDHQRMSDVCWIRGLKYRNMGTQTNEIDLFTSASEASGHFCSALETKDCKWKFKIGIIFEKNGFNKLRYWYCN